MIIFIIIYSKFALHDVWNVKLVLNVYVTISVKYNLLLLYFSLDC